MSSADDAARRSCRPSSDADLASRPLLSSKVVRINPIRHQPSRLRSLFDVPHRQPRSLWTLADQPPGQEAIVWAIFDRHEHATQVLDSIPFPLVQPALEHELQPFTKLRRVDMKRWTDQHCTSDQQPPTGSTSPSPFSSSSSIQRHGPAFASRLDGDEFQLGSNEGYQDHEDDLSLSSTGSSLSTPLSATMDTPIPPPAQPALVRPTLDDKRTPMPSTTTAASMSVSPESPKTLPVIPSLPALHWSQTEDTRREENDKQTESEHDAGGTYKPAREKRVGLGPAQNDEEDDDGSTPKPALDEEESSHPRCYPGSNRKARRPRNSWLTSKGGGELNTSSGLNLREAGLTVKEDEEACVRTDGLTASSIRPPSITNDTTDDTQADLSIATTAVGRAPSSSSSSSSPSRPPSPALLLQPPSVMLREQAPPSVPSHSRTVRPRPPFGREEGQEEQEEQEEQVEMHVNVGYAGGGDNVSQVLNGSEDGNCGVPLEGTLRKSVDGSRLQEGGISHAHLPGPQPAAIPLGSNGRATKSSPNPSHSSSTLAATSAASAAKAVRSSYSPSPSPSSPPSSAFPLKSTAGLLTTTTTTMAAASSTLTASSSPYFPSLPCLQSSNTPSSQPSAPFLGRSCSYPPISSTQNQEPGDDTTARATATVTAHDPSLRDRPRTNDVPSVPPAAFRQGDWICPRRECETHNFGRNVVCIVCGTARSLSSIVSTTTNNNNNRHHYCHDTAGLGPTGSILTRLGSRESVRVGNTLGPNSSDTSSPTSFGAAVGMGNGSVPVHYASSPSPSAPVGEKVATSNPGASMGMSMGMGTRTAKVIGGRSTPDIGSNAQHRPASASSLAFRPNSAAPVPSPLGTVPPTPGAGGDPDPLTAATTGAMNSGLGVGSSAALSANHNPPSSFNEGSNPTASGSYRSSTVDYSSMQHPHGPSSSTSGLANPKTSGSSGLYSTSRGGGHSGSTGALPMNTESVQALGGVDELASIQEAIKAHQSQAKKGLHPDTGRNPSLPPSSAQNQRYNLPFASAAATHPLLIPTTLGNSPPTPLSHGPVVVGPNGTVQLPDPSGRRNTTRISNSSTNAPNQPFSASSAAGVKGLVPSPTGALFPSLSQAQQLVLAGIRPLPSPTASIPLQVGNSSNASKMPSILTPSGRTFAVGGRVRNISNDDMNPVFMFWPDNEPLPETTQIRPPTAVLLALGGVHGPPPPILNTGNKGPIDAQPGDWTCGKCDYLNWRRRRVCANCYPHAEGNTEGTKHSTADMQERVALLASVLLQQQQQQQQIHAAQVQQQQLQQQQMYMQVQSPASEFLASYQPSPSYPSGLTQGRRDSAGIRNFSALGAQRIASQSVDPFQVLANKYGYAVPPPSTHTHPSSQPSHQPSLSGTQSNAGFNPNLPPRLANPNAGPGVRSSPCTEMGLQNHPAHVEPLNRDALSFVPGQNRTASATFEQAAGMGRAEPYDSFGGTKALRETHPSPPSSRSSFSLGYGSAGSSSYFNSTNSVKFSDEPTPSPLPLLPAFLQEVVGDASESSSSRSSVHESPSPPSTASTTSSVYVNVRSKKGLDLQSRRIASLPHTQKYATEGLRRESSPSSPWPLAYKHHEEMDEHYIGRL